MRHPVLKSSVHLLLSVCQSLYVGIQGSIKIVDFAKG